MFEAQLRDIDAMHRREAEQPQVERIAGACRHVGIVREHNRPERAWHIKRVERSNVHATFGERACLVGSNHGDRSECLDG